MASTLIFAQEEAGTAVCISPDGLLLTCSHCVAETADELDLQRRFWLLFASGRAVAARCVAWDSRRDLALLRIVAAQSDDERRDAPERSEFDAADASSAAAPEPRIPMHLQPQSNIAMTFPSCPVATLTPSRNTRLLCIGQPGAEDLEAPTAGRKTGYAVLHVSTGAYRDLAPSQDPQDNVDIGALMHDCWTYWGHSGAPLVERGSGRGGGGRLVGLHSSWDDETGMRRGVPLVAVRAFLKEQGVALPEA